PRRAGPDLEHGSVVVVRLPALTIASEDTRSRGPQSVASEAVPTCRINDSNPHRVAGARLLRRAPRIRMARERAASARTVQKPIAADCCTIRGQTAGLKMRQIAGSLGPT